MLECSKFIVQEVLPCSSPYGDHLVDGPNWLHRMRQSTMIATHRLQDPTDLNVLVVFDGYFFLRYCCRCVKAEFQYQICRRSWRAAPAEHDHQKVPLKDTDASSCQQSCRQLQHANRSLCAFLSSLTAHSIPQDVQHLRQSEQSAQALKLQYLW